MIREEDKTEWFKFSGTRIRHRRMRTDCKRVLPDASVVQHEQTRHSFTDLLPADLRCYLVGSGY